MSAELVNLRRVRKAKARAAHEAEAAANRASHGRSGGERDAVRREAEVAARRHEAHRLERSPGPDDGDAA